MIKFKYYDTLVPYDNNTEYQRNRMAIQYGNCVDFASSHYSRYQCLRTVNHSWKILPTLSGANSKATTDQCVTLESVNPIYSNMEVIYYTVRAEEENRLDIIANKYLGSAKYSWVLAYINQIRDGYTVLEGTKLKIPASRSVVSFSSDDEMLGPINPLMLNLGEE